MQVKIDFITNDVVRVCRNRELSETTIAIVTRKREEISVEERKSEDVVDLITEKIKVRLKSGLVNVYSKDDTLLFQELEFKEEENNVVWSHRIPDGVHIYGFGEKGGPLDKRGWKKLRLENIDPGLRYRDPDTDPLYINIPFYIMAKKGYAVGIYIDSSSFMDVDPGVSRGDVLTIRKVGRDLDYYLFVGESVREVVKLFTELVGRTYMPPIWALGFHQSKWSYKNKKEVLEVARKFRKLGIPCDAIHLDIHYMDSYRVFTWHPKRFPNPKETIDGLHKMGFKVVTIFDPFIKLDKNYEPYKEAMEKKYYVRSKNKEPFIAYGWCGKAIMPDLTNKDAQRWWGSLYLKFVEKYSIDGVWNDMNEPSIETRLRYLFGFGLKREKMMFYNEGKYRSIEEIGNIYGMLEAMVTYETLKTTGKRFFTLSRSGFAGIQRYSANWTGDIWSKWKHLKRSISMLLNMGLCGLVFVGADIGGFAPIFFRVNKKLFTRWIQLGVFYPFMRIHYMVHKPCQEPWCFDKRVLDVSREAIRLRYRLIPYIYSLFWEAHNTGIPIMRPLFLEFPEDDTTYSIDDEFMFGPALLVAPIVSKEDRRSVYIPSGYWLEYWKNEKKYSRGEWIEIKANIDEIPMFIRDGGIVPMQEPQNYLYEQQPAQHHQL